MSDIENIVSAFYLFIMTFNIQDINIFIKSLKDLNFKKQNKGSYTKNIS